MRKKIISLATISLMAVSAQASDLVYDYVELGYSSADLGDSIDGDGLKIAGSFSLLQRFSLSRRNRQFPNVV